MYEPLNPVDITEEEFSNEYNYHQMFGSVVKNKAAYSAVSSRMGSFVGNRSISSSMNIMNGAM